MEKLVAVVCAVVAIFIVGTASQQAAQDQNLGAGIASSYK